MMQGMKLREIAAKASGKEREKPKPKSRRGGFGPRKPRIQQGD
jgi:hypothetical protein